MGFGPSYMSSVQCPVVDRRRHLVTLTAAGQRRFDSATRAQRGAEGTLFAGLDNDQPQQLRAVLVTLRDSLGWRTRARVPATRDDCGLLRLKRPLKPSF